MSKKTLFVLAPAAAQWSRLGLRFYLLIGLRFGTLKLSSQGSLRKSCSYHSLSSVLGLAHTNRWIIESKAGFWLIF